jgi:DNA-damage-inducible protein D
MGYQRWEDFSTTVIGRAIRSAENTGTFSDQAFSAFTEDRSGGRGRQDYRLSRQAAYLVAMNGDPNKEQVAAAQVYFAEKTHLAEILQMPTHAVALRGWAAELEAREAAERKAAELTAENKVLAPKAGKWEALCNAEGLIDMGAAAKAFAPFTGGLGRTKFMDMLRSDDVQFLQVQNPRIPYEQHIKAARAKVKFVKAGPTIVEQTLFTAKGMDWLADRLGIGAAAIAIAS